MEKLTLAKLIVISGAGLSVASGVRAFRTDTDSGKAMWDEYDLEEVCNIQAFRGNFYHKTHTFYNKRREELGTVEPNVAHLRIAEWYERYPGKVKNVTTNVDDLLERAGIPEEDIVHVHGRLTYLRYMVNEGDAEQCVDIGYTQIEPDDYYWCKPDVVFFGEMAPKYQDMYNVFDDIMPNDVIILVGASNQVINFIWDLFPAINRGAQLIVVNPQIDMNERYQMESNGIRYFRTTAEDAFCDPEFLALVEGALERG